MTVATAAPAAASRITTRPLPALALSGGIAVASVWIGLTASYTIPRLPPSFAILAVATLTYLAAVTASHPRRHRPAALIAAAAEGQATAEGLSATPPDHATWVRPRPWGR